jgi:hypothetical protein
MFSALKSHNRFRVSPTPSLPPPCRPCGGSFRWRT